MSKQEYRVQMKRNKVRTSFLMKIKAAFPDVQSLAKKMEEP